MGGMVHSTGLGARALRRAQALGELLVAHAAARQEERPARGRGSSVRFAVHVLPARSRRLVGGLLRTRGVR